MQARKLIADGHQLIVADLEPEDLLAVADLPEAKDAVILNARSSEDSLRGADCRRNVFHVAPSFAMRADALGQYLAWKKWRKWLVLIGDQPSNQDYAAAIRRAASRYGAKIVDERKLHFDPGNRRSETGHQQIQTQIPMLTQEAPEHDVVFVVDNDETFGEYLMWRTATPKPVVGTQGLVAVAWHRSFEQYGGVQLQNRFQNYRQAHHDRARLSRLARRQDLRRGRDTFRQRRLRRASTHSCFHQNSASPPSRGRL